MDDREGTSKGQGNSSPDPRPLIEWFGFYSRAQVLDRMEIGKDVLAGWHRDGLKFCCRGTKQYYYYGGDIIQFQRGEAGTGNPPLPPDVAPALRQKGVTKRSGKNPGGK